MKKCIDISCTREACKIAMKNKIKPSGKIKIDQNIANMVRENMKKK